MFHAPAENINCNRGGCGCGRGRGKGAHGEVSCTNKGRGSGDSRCNKSHIKCYNCYKMGYYTNECDAPKKKEEETQLTRTDDTKLALLLTVLEEVPGLQQR